MDKKRLVFFSAVFVLFVSLLMIRVQDPWIYRNDDNGAWHSAIARTHLLKGLAETRGQDFFTTRKDNTLAPYLHHPPLPGLYLASFFKLTGNDSPTAARGAFIIVHVLSFFVFFMIARILFDKNDMIRAWALIIFAIVPMSVFYGKMPNHEPLGLLFILCVFYGYIIYESGLPKKWPWITLAAVFTFSAAMSSWHALFVLSGIALHGSLIERKNKGGYATTIWLTMLVGATVVILQILWANDWKLLTSQGVSFSAWFTNTSPDKYATCLIGIVRHTLFFFGILPSLFALAWLFAFFQKKVRVVPKNSLLVIFAAGGSLLHGLLFARAWRMHAYQPFYWLPFIAVESAWFIECVREQLLPQKRRAFQIFYATALAITLLSSAVMLSYLYTHPSDYATKTTSSLEKNYH